MGVRSKGTETTGLEWSFPLCVATRPLVAKYNAHLAPQLPALILHLQAAQGVSASHRPENRGQLYPDKVPTDSASPEFTYLNVSLSNSLLHAEVTQQYVSHVWLCFPSPKAPPNLGMDQPPTAASTRDWPSPAGAGPLAQGGGVGRSGPHALGTKQLEPAGPTAWLVRSPIPCPCRPVCEGPACHLAPATMSETPTGLIRKETEKLEASRRLKSSKSKEINVICNIFPLTHYKTKLHLHNRDPRRQPKAWL